MMIGKVIEAEKGLFLQKNKKVFTNKTHNRLPKPNKAAPRSVSSKGSSGSSTSSGGKSRGSRQTFKKPISKPTDNFVKPKYQWKPKSLSNSSLKSSEESTNEDPNLKILKSDSKKPKRKSKFVMTWVPKSK